MISVLTLTYQRHNLLEEAIQSFLLQDCVDCEMVIINDSPNTHYIYQHPKIKIYNLPQRFESLSKKLEWGFEKCSCEYIYRLDDDDLLGPKALEISKNFIINNPNYEIYRPKTHYFFLNNKYEKICGNVNNGNIYTKSYLNRIEFPNTSFGEDYDITFEHNPKIYEDEGNPTMIYRWGMSTYHISGFGEITTEELYSRIDSMTKNNTGTFELKPVFRDNYYEQIFYKK
jgi:hypothetical protein